MAKETPKRRSTDDPSNLSPDEVIVAQVLDEIIEANRLKHVIIFWARIITVLCLVIGVLVVALQIQVDRRNDTIDRVERVACGFSQFIPADRRGDVFKDCDRFGVPVTTTTTEE